MLNGHALLQSRLQWLAAARTRIPAIVNFSENGSAVPLSRQLIGQAALTFRFALVSLQKNVDEKLSRRCVR